MSLLSRSLFKIRWPFVAGLLLLTGYAVTVFPPGAIRGYVEDFCMLDTTRALIAEQVTETGRPTFVSQAFMHPVGTSEAYMPYTLETSGLGAVFWKINPDFPFFWCLFAVSLLISYLGVGYFSRKIGLNPLPAWGLATVIVGFNIARHFKHWHHIELVLLHWIYLSIFLDGWIWSRFEREKKWSWSLDAWRAWMMLMTLGTAGYYWGPLLLEWTLVRVGMLLRYRKGMRPQIEGNRKSAAIAGSLSLVWIGVLFWWFLPLFREINKLGWVDKSLDWFGTFSQLARPVWFDDAWNWLGPKMGLSLDFDRFPWAETVVTTGWVFWIPTLATLFLLRKRRGGPGLGRVAPFLILTLLGVGYVVRPPYVGHALQAFWPFMGYFRVATRWGLFFPALLGVIVVLGWDLFTPAIRKIWSQKRTVGLFAFGLFAVSSLAELSYLRVPVTRMEPLRPEMRELLEGVKATPGTAVLDIPNCTTGANGVCNDPQCPFYPRSTAGLCWHGFHGKQVYGAYQSRMVWSQCDTYNREPYGSWYRAWKENRCFTESDWKGFCSYLDEHTELAAVLVYPDLWSAAGQPDCWSQFEKHLGMPHKTAQYQAIHDRGEGAPELGRISWFSPKCLTPRKPQP
jgi:hypothetical protein